MPQLSYHVDDIVSIDMKACYPASFHGLGEAQPYFQRFGHPRARMTRVAVNNALLKDIGTGFAQVTGWAFKEDVHPVIAAWFGKHFDEQGWGPTPLLSYLTESSLLSPYRILVRYIFPDSTRREYEVVQQYSPLAFTHRDMPAINRRITAPWVIRQKYAQWHSLHCT